MFDIFYSGPKPNLFPHEQSAATIEQARELSRTRYFWWINYLTDYTDFDFLWEPVPWEADQQHVWPSQHQDHGGTMLVPRRASTDVNYNHVKLKRIGSVPVVGIDHGNGIKFDCKYRTRYISDYLGTLRRVLSKVEEEYVWVASSVCDYTWFNWTWHPSEWQQDMLHVFASHDQKFGDTFYVHVPSFLAKSQNIKLLEWFDTIHFVENIQVPRLPVPVVHHTHDTHVQAVWQHEFQDPVVEFRVQDYDSPTVAINLWREEMRTIVPLTPGASSILVPREAKNYLKTQLYDYPYIDKRQRIGPDEPLDIVFIDNGEVTAGFNWLQLPHTREDLKIHRSSGVVGRIAAYRAAAELSTTPWFFAVFAKLQLDDAFDFTWQPDRLQESKHYIFHALNPVNGLIYGHQAIIAYNKKLVLENTAPGLDFTLDQAHEVVPVLSGTANYHYDAWTCWRTAFRECIKLKHSLPDIENEFRLRQWLTKDNTKEQWSRKGAEDAVEYYDAVKGNFDELKKSYDWAWLASYAFIKHSLSPDQ
jgi:hypothetical protein